MQLGWCYRRIGVTSLLCWTTLCLLALSHLKHPNIITNITPVTTPHPTLTPVTTLAQNSPLPTARPPINWIDEPAMRWDVEERLPSLPLAYWYAHRNDLRKFHKLKECAPLPSIYELDFHNTYWQTHKTSSGVFHLYGAYLDLREASRFGPVVRLLVVHDGFKPEAKTFCQLWFHEIEPPIIVRVLEYKLMWRAKWGNSSDAVLQPYLLSCALRADVRHLKPRAVSLVERPCNLARNLLRVHYEPPATPADRRDIAVCVKGLDYMHEDPSVRLVEWIELVLLLGADAIHFYELHVHPNVSRVLARYESLGRVTVTRTSLPGGAPNLPALQHLYLTKKSLNKQQMELVPYNDCLYRHMYRYRWIVLLDIDEMIVPLEDMDWPALLRDILLFNAGNRPRSSFHVTQMSFFCQPRGERTMPHHLPMLQRVWRSQNYTEPLNNVRAFHVTDSVLFLHNHLPRACLGACSSYAVEPRRARLQHYRADCVQMRGCVHAVRDTALWRWQNLLVARAQEALKELGLLPPSEPNR